MDKPTVYIETTIVSYLTARPTYDLRRMARQLATRDWWDAQRPQFDLFTSDLVIVEAGAGDPDAASRRLAVLGQLETVPAVERVDELADELISATAVPNTERRDALHIATAALAGLDYLLTWNCSHLANAALRRKIEQTCTAFGVRPPAITTPDTLTVEPDDD